MERLRLAELLAGLSLLADTGMGLDPGQAARTALLATELAAAIGAEDPQDVYYAALLQHVGCTAFAHEAARMFGGDELVAKRAAVHLESADAQDPALVEGYSRANCEVAARTAERVGLGPGVVTALLDVYEQWDGTGGPRRLRGEAIAQPARIVQVAATAALFHHEGGPDAAVDAVRRRAGGLLDPRLAEAVRPLVGVLDVPDPLAAAVAVEPAPAVLISDPGLDRVCRAFGEAVDLKTPLHHGHATGVAELAAAAAERAGLAAPAIVELRRAALLHDIGRAAIPNGVWERPGPLTWADQERVRLHAYHSERVLARSGPLAGLATVAGMHHERLDGSGYHRQASAAAIGLPGRILAASDVFQAMTQARAHRPARTREEAGDVLAAEARGGRLDPDAVRAVLDAAGQHPSAIRRARPAGLTERQVEVLRLVAQGLSNPQIAERLVISRRTAERHVQDVYARIGVSSRAGAALFAMEHDLLAAQDS
jgi:HD-GYP domain-containing protein (c-di-GMP phosphodiesterase class II)